MDRENNLVNLLIVLNKMHLQAFSDVVGKVGEVLFVFLWQYDASHTSPLGLERLFIWSVIFG